MRADREDEHPTVNISKRLAARVGVGGVGGASRLEKYINIEETNAFSVLVVSTGSYL